MSGNFWLIVSNMFLTIITGFYIKATYDLSSRTQEYLEITNRPYVAIRTFDTQMTNGAHKDTASLQNGGTSPGIISEAQILSQNDTLINKIDIDNVVNAGQAVQLGLPLFEKMCEENAECNVKIVIDYTGIIKNQKYKTEYLLKIEDGKNPVILDVKMQ